MSQTLTELQRVHTLTPLFILSLTLACLFVCVGAQPEAHRGCVRVSDADRPARSAHIGSAWHVTGGWFHIRCTEQRCVDWACASVLGLLLSPFPTQLYSCYLKSFSNSYPADQGIHRLVPVFLDTTTKLLAIYEVFQSCNISFSADQGIRRLMPVPLDTQAR